MNRIAAVIIGRNEGEKLRRCLSSVLGMAAPIVFVDSGSEDGSAGLARTMGVDAVELDRSAPFTVARARNAGCARVVQLDPQVECIQFVDADSEMIPSWFAHAGRVLLDSPDAGVVFGRTQERRPNKSIYSRLYQMEFEAQAHEPDTCGGMVMMRVSALHDAGGFNPTMLGFEDYELCVRLRRAGWRVLRLAAPMAVHEAAMTRFTQWWTRQVRGGHARAHEAALHGRAPERYRIRECGSIWFWGVCLPVLAVAAAGPTGGTSVWLLAGYPFLFVRVYRRTRRYGVARAHAALYAASCVAGKFPQVIGQIQFFMRPPETGTLLRHP